MEHNSNDGGEDRPDPIMHADGFEGAVIGVAYRFGQNPVIAYSHSVCLQILEAQGLTRMEALEHIECNLIGSWVGKGTPVVIYEMDFNEVQEFILGVE